MHRTDRRTRLSLVSMAMATIWACLAGMLALASGGLSSGAVLLLAFPPVISAVYGARAELYQSVLAGLTGVALLAFIELAALVPPPVEGVSQGAALIATGLITVAGFLFFSRGQAESGRAVPSHNVTDPLVKDAAAGFPRLSEQGDVLVLAVSPGGRIYRIWGARALIPGLDIGQDAVARLRDRDGKTPGKGRVRLSDGSTGLLVQQKMPAGSLYIVVRAPESAVQEEVEALQEKLLQRTQFFAGLGHDLRSPLNAVVGFADVMASEIAGPLPEAYREYPGLIRESGEYLLRLIEDMLALARSEAGTYELHVDRVDVAAIAEDVIRAAAPVADRAGVRLSLDTGTHTSAMADEDAIHRIWDNLVSNAVKYSDQDSQVVLAVRRKGNMLELSVTDEGAGMDADDLARVDAPFEQGRNARGKAGTGLGLAMVKRLVELQGGQVRFRSAPGEGTTVTVTLPAID